MLSGFSSRLALAVAICESESDKVIVGGWHILKFKIYQSCLASASPPPSLRRRRGGGASDNSSGDFIFSVLVDENIFLARWVCLTEAT